MGDVIEGADRFIISLAGAEWFGNIAGQGGGGRSGQIGDYIFTMDAPVNRNTVFGRIRRLFIYVKGGGL